MTASTLGYSLITERIGFLLVGEDEFSGEPLTLVAEGDMSLASTARWLLFSVDYGDGSSAAFQ